MKHELNERISAINTIKCGKTLSDEIVKKFQKRLSILKFNLNHQETPNIEWVSKEISDWQLEYPAVSNDEVLNVLQN
ncbi:hypothetical protein [Algoriphagus sp.]|uniref:hypothetical protein n=1 Tax=Algoriphagus sp. TaxID=1872435 RepID=UPI00391901EA